MLVGRDRERRVIDLALERARLGKSATLALIGEPGIGKTALLDYAAERLDGMLLLRARGIESERQIPFASLLELLRPALGAVAQIPKPQAVALEGALALRPATAHERFAVGAATLSLLAAHADHDPMAVLIDDAQWLDDPSAQAILFAIRRLLADPIAVVIAVREGEPSLLDGSDIETVRLAGLSASEAGELLDGLTPNATSRLLEATAGNPLALLELAADAEELAALAPAGAPLLVSASISSAFLRRAGDLDPHERRALLLAATSDAGDLTLLERAARLFETDLSGLAAAESTGLVSLRGGAVEFRHPLARSAVYADASPVERRSAHRALAASLPDRDIDRRAWHLAAAAAGVDETASSALEHAGRRARDRSAYASAGAAFERAARLAEDAERRARLLCAAAEASWHAGLADRAIALLGEARASGSDPATLLDLDELEGHIATRCGPVMRGHAILTGAAERADGERAVAMLAEAASACFLAGNPHELLPTAERAFAALPEGASERARFLAGVAVGIAHIVGGDAAAGAEEIQQAIELAERTPALGDDPQLLPWLAVAPLFLRDTRAGRVLLEQALGRSRERAAIGTLPLVLIQIAVDHATTDRWPVAEATYLEAIGLARESDQRTNLAFGLAGLARLHARRGQAAECLAEASEALSLSERLGTRLTEVWAVEALGMLALGRGEAADAVEHYERQLALLDELRITDPDLSPAPELVESYLRLGRAEQATRLAAEFHADAEAKGQPWALARGLRCEGLTADASTFATSFARALERHAETPDVFEMARTCLAYGERLRRVRRRVQAREQLEAAAEAFERLGASRWAERARAELQATGVTARRRDPATIDELTPQELQISMLLAAGKTTREAAAALFLSPKTIEYHLRHVYLKLGIHSREELALALPDSSPSTARRAGAIP